jgi:nitrous oxidase accessory protein NosD
VDIRNRTDITLRGAGPEQTILDGAGVDAVDGIYAEYSDGLTIEDLAVRGFPRNEIQFGTREGEGSGGRDIAVRNTFTAGAGEYGIGVFQGAEVVLEDNEATESLFGLYVGVNEHCDCDVVGNDVYANDSIGILIAHVGDIRLLDNDVHDNNVGIFALIADPGIELRANRVTHNSQGIQIGATDEVVLAHNVIADNNRVSTEPNDHPAGFGVALWGSSGAEFAFNRITGHQAAGIEVIDQSSWRDGTVSADNRLCPNVFEGNERDILVDSRGGGNRWACIGLPSVAR